MQSIVFIHICVFVFVFAANPWTWGGQHRLAWEADGGQAAAGWDGQQATGKKKSCKETGGDAGDEDDGDYDDDDDGDNDVGNYGGCVASDDGGAQQQNVAEVLLRDKCLVFLYITNVIKCGLNIVVDRQGHAENNIEQILFRKNTFSDAATDSIGSGPSCTLTLSSSGPEVKIFLQNHFSFLSFSVKITPFLKITFVSQAFPGQVHCSTSKHKDCWKRRAKKTGDFFLHQSAISDITEETPIHHFLRMLEEAVSTLKEQVNIYEQEVDQVN